MELHVWCPIPGSPTLDSACLAALWLANESDHEVQIMQSSATHLSPSGALPLLIDDNGVKITGLVEIAEHLGHEIQADELALVAYLQQLDVITQWTLYLVKENYEDVTRPEISHQIPFPMQYNAALARQKYAQSLQPAQAKGGAQQKFEEGLNKLHSAMLERNAEQERAKQVPKANIQRMTQFAEIRNTVTALNIRQGSVGEYLLAANLLLLTLGKLTVKPLEAQIEQDMYLTECRDRGRARNFKLKDVVEVPSDRKHSLVNVAATYLGYT